VLFRFFGLLGLFGGRGWERGNGGSGPWTEKKDLDGGLWVGDEFVLKYH
jgi:hypothetical protein